MPWILVILLLTLLDQLTQEVACVRLADIYWNATNPIFRIDNTDHIIDVNKGNIPFEYDQVNIICPVYTPGTREEEVERYIIYNVSKDEYDSCRITKPNARIIAKCDKPHQLMYFTITFRSFTPQPGGLEFRPGQDYYFISTSDGGDHGLEKRIGGRCATHNMKVIFKVCCKPSKSKEVTLPARTTASVKTTTTTTTTPVFTTSTTTPKTPMQSSSTPKWMRPLMPTRNIKTDEEKPVDDTTAKQNSKKPGRDRLPNETRAKNEELTGQASRVTSTGCVLVTVVLLSLTHAAR